MGSQVSFSAPRVAEIVQDTEVPLGAAQVRVRTLFSGISAGTELTSYRGSNPNLTKTWDSQSRLFVEGTDRVSFPMSGFGYEEVGEVIEVANGVTAPVVGDRIWGTWGHRTSAVLEADFAAARVLDGRSASRHVLAHRGHRAQRRARRRHPRR
jgi:threonine dehydrogenase-like Zn-dependent dehydrogenase